MSIPQFRRYSVDPTVRREVLDPLEIHGSTCSSFVTHVETAFCRSKQVLATRTSSVHKGRDKRPAAS